MAYHRTKREREEDFKIMCKYRELGYTWAQVTEYINRIRPYKTSEQANFTLYSGRIKKKISSQFTAEDELNKMIADLEAIMSKALHQFERSTTELVSVTETGEVIPESNKLVNVIRRVQTIQREGNPKYLDIFMKAVLIKAKLAGLDKAPGGGEDQDDVSQILKQIMNRPLPAAPRKQQISSEAEMRRIDDQEGFDDYQVV